MMGTDLRYLRRDENARRMRELETFGLLEYGDPNVTWYLPPVSTNGQREDVTGAAKPKAVALVESARFGA